MDKIKNVIIVSDFGYVEGGASQVAQNTALALQAAGKTVFFFCGAGPAAQCLTDSGIRVTCLGHSDILHEKNRVRAVLRGIHNSAAAKAFAELLSRFSPEDTVIHAHTWTKVLSSAIFPVARRNGFRVFLTVHDYFLVCPNGGLFDYPRGCICQKQPLSAACLLCNCDARSYPQKLFRILRQWHQNRNIRGCGNISYIFISEFSKTQLLRRYNGIPEQKRYFIPNTVSFPDVRRRTPCESNNTFLFVGTLSEIKGIRQFCQAVTAAGVAATVIGTGPLHQHLQQQYPNIHFAGWRSKEEMIPYIAQARCLVFPSVWYEASPLTVPELMAYGVPVICSDKNAASDWIEAGKNGWVYDGADVGSLAQTITEVKDYPHIQEMSETVFASFDADEYGKENYVRRLLRVYNL